MRHLKSYKIFESVDFPDLEKEIDPLIRDIENILVELTDENWDDNVARFSVSVSPIGPLKDSDDKLGILMRINRPEGFTLKDIEDTLDRIDSYLNNEGYYTKGEPKFNGYILYKIYRYKL